jgi:EmrB/QacA subfamily drug resistance transporter
VTAPDRQRRWLALAALGTAYLMVVLDGSIVNVALPSLQRDLGFSSTGLQWVVSGYALSFGGLLLLGGRSGDLLGRRRVFMAGLALFTLSSLLCGLAVSPGMLIATRILQGAAGAILSPSVFSIVSVTFAEGRERNKALGVLGAIAGSGAALGVILGGLLTEYLGWQWIFFVNVPIGALALVFVPLLVRESRAPDLDRHFDAGGAISITAGLMLLVYALTRAPTVGWGSLEVLLALAGWALLSSVFVAIELRSPSPLVPLAFVRRRTLAGANGIGLLLGSMVFAMFFLLSLYMQQVLAFSALETGFGFLAVALTAIAASAVAQALVSRLGVKPVLVGGLLLVAAGLLLFTRLPVEGFYLADVFPGLVVSGVGLGFAFVPLSIAALSGVGDREAGLASGLINTSQQIGGALGLALLTSVSSARTDALVAAGADLPRALTEGFRLAFAVAAAFAPCAVAVALVVLRRRDLRAAKGAPEPAHETA